MTRAIDWSHIEPLNDQLIAEGVVSRTEGAKRLHVSEPGLRKHEATRQHALTAGASAVDVPTNGDDEPLRINGHLPAIPASRRGQTLHMTALAGEGGRIHA
jgi:hypothetical protein